MGTILILATTAWSACSTRTIDPLRLDANRLIVNNRTSDDWNHVEIWVNRQYRVAVPKILAGQRYDAPLNEFLEGYGHRFNFARQQINDVRLSATLPDGQPVALRLDFHASGLAGLSGAGIFKGKQ
jgi:hypothetical protein